MTPDIIDSYAKLGIAGLAVGALVYVFIFYIKHTTKQHEAQVQALAGVERALDKIAVVTEKTGNMTAENTAFTKKTGESMDMVAKILIEHNNFVKDMVATHPGTPGTSSSP